uniref:Uncharacterized protein n=1 Tax=Triticum urartu TaxID=4572 RepID=A0A8R7U2Z2_TRIUA
MNGHAAFSHAISVSLFLGQRFSLLESYSGQATCAVKFQLFIRVDFYATNAYCLVHPSSGVQDILLDAAVPNELSLPEEVQKQVKHPLGPCILSYIACTSSLMAASSLPPSVCDIFFIMWQLLVYGSIFNNKDMSSGSTARNAGSPG